MAIQEKYLNKMQRIYRLLNNAELIKTPSIDSADPVVIESYGIVNGVTWSNPIGGTVIANNFTFAPIEAGSEPNAVVLQSTGDIWAVGSVNDHPQSNTNYYKSTFDIITSPITADTAGRIGRRIGGATYNYIIYKVSQAAYELVDVKIDIDLSSVNIVSVDEVYPEVNNPQWEGQHYVEGIRVQEQYGYSYFIKKYAIAESGTIDYDGPYRFPYAAAPYSLAYNLTEYATEPLIFTAPSSLTIPNIKIELKKEGDA